MTKSLINKVLNLFGLGNEQSENGKESHTEEEPEPPEEVVEDDSDGSDEEV